MTNNKRGGFSARIGRRPLGAAAVVMGLWALGSTAWAVNGCPAGTAPGPNLLANGDFSVQPAGPLAAGGDLGGWTIGAPYLGVGQYATDTTMSIWNGTLGAPTGLVYQTPFPGDAANGVPAVDSWLYVNGNTLGAYDILSQPLTGLTPGQQYVFAGYVSNVIAPGQTGPVPPKLVLKAGADASAVQTVPQEATDDTWQRIEFAFTPAAGTTTLTVALRDVQTESYGDDLAITALSVHACTPVAGDIGSNAPAGGLDFGSQQVGTTSAAQTVTISNSGGAPLTITGAVTLAGTNPDQFEVTADTCSNGTLAAGADCAVTVVFKPTAVGPASATLNVPSDDPDTNPLTVPLKGTGVAAPAGDIATDAPAAGLDFGSQQVSTTSAAQTVTVTNNGTAPLTVSAVTVAGSNAGDFAADGTACTGAPLAAGASCAIPVTFTPSAVGPRAATLTIASDDPDSPSVTVPLTGTGLAAPAGDVDLGAAAGGLDFGAVEVGQSAASKTITVANQGNAALTLGAVTLGGADAGQFTFDASACAGRSLPAGGSCAIVVGFAPTSLGAKTATVTITSDDPDEPSVTVPLQGVGTGPEDRDNDGIADRDEPALGTDPDKADTDGDGIPDGIEVGDPANPKDTDGDTVIDALEPNNLDTDGDGRVNFNDPDDDGEGGPTGPDGEAGPDPRNPPDTDGDGIPDYLDADSLNAAATADSSGDSDGDGLSDKAECGDRAPFCVDPGQGGVPDYMKPRQTAVLRESETRDEIKTGLEGGVGGGAAGLPLLGLLAAAALWRRRRVAALAGLAGSALLAGVAPPAGADQGQGYVGAGVGISKIEPDTSGTSYSVADDNDMGWKVLLGYDLSKYWSLEAFWADLGQSDLNPNGAIDYRAYGLQGVLYMPGSVPGLSAFLKLGVGRLDTYSNNVPFTQVEDTQLIGGLGAEYQFANHLSVRGEYEYFDEDAQLVSVNLLGRFGGAEPPPPPPPPPPAPAPEPAPTPKLEDSDHDGVFDISDRCPHTPEGVQVDGAGCPIDRDGDGVLNSRDKCPDTNPGTKVDDVGCPLVEKFSGVLEGVTFYTGSDRLTENAKAILDGVAEQLLRYPTVHVLVVGHTDNVGSAAYNKQLSLRRARAVARYLVSRGVEAARLRYAGKGEAEPRASNATPEGRALNRRVEFIVTQQ